MNKIAFISDIHGNHPALQAVLNDIDKRNIKTIICLGDIVGYYSMINEVIETLRERKITTIMGNHDYAMVNTHGVIERSKTCTAVLKKQLTYITPQNLEFISQLPDHFLSENNGKSFFCIHGGLHDYIDEYLIHADSGYFEKHNFKNDVLATGHTHQFIFNKVGKQSHINPSSVGQPRDNDNRASYLITDGVEVNQIRVEYDIDKIVADMKALNFDEYIYKGLYTGKKIS